MAGTGLGVGATGLSDLDNSHSASAICALVPFLDIVFFTASNVAGVSAIARTMLVISCKFCGVSVWVKSSTRSRPGPAGGCPNANQAKRAAVRHPTVKVRMALLLSALSVSTPAGREACRENMISYLQT